MQFGVRWSRHRFAGRAWFAVGLGLLIGPALAAQPAGNAQADEPHTAEPPKVRAQLVSDHIAVRPGKLAWLGVRLTIKEDWHVYWDGLNDTGMPLTASFKASPGVRVGPLVWPAPTRYTVGDFQLDHIYKDDALILVPITIPTDAAPGSEIHIEANLQWLVCDEICLLETDTVSIRLPVVEPGTIPKRSLDWARFERARARLPAPSPDTPAPDALAPHDTIPVQITLVGTTLRVRGPDGSFIAFYPENDCQPPSDLIREGASETGELVVNFEGPTPVQVRGLIEIRHDGKTNILHIADPPADPPTEKNPKDKQKNNDHERNKSQDDPAGSS